MKGRIVGNAPEPGSPGWLKLMTASKIAAVVGLSPYESRFSLWHRMAGLIPPTPDSDELRRGHYLEPAIVAWFRDQHPEVCSIQKAGTWTHANRDWQAASPDRLIFNTGTTMDDLSAVLELKTAADLDGWGAAGTDEIPPGYRAQVMWQLDTLGLQTAYVAVLLPYLEFREYRIEYNAAEAEALVDAGRRFMDSLPDGAFPSRPNLDGHTETFLAVKQLHPEIEDQDVEIDPLLASDYRSALTAFTEAEYDKRKVCAQVLDVIGAARRAVCNGETVAIRVPGRNGGTPFLRPGRTSARSAAA